MELILLHCDILPISTLFSFQSKCDQRILNLEILSWICILIFQFNYSVFFKIARIFNLKVALLMKVIKEDSSSQGKKKKNNKKSLIFMIPKLIIVVHFFLAPLEIVSMSKSH